MQIAKAIAVTVLTLSLCSPAWGFTRDQALRLAKQRFEVGLTKVADFIGSCRSLPTECRFDDRESRMTHAIYWEVIRGLASAQGGPELVFQAESENPGSFHIDGQVRIAKTGSAVGDPIYVNTDLIIEESLLDGYLPISFGQALAVLTHELGHHHHGAVDGDVSHEELDVLGNKIRALAEINTSTIEITYEWPALDSAVGEKIAISIVNSPGQPGQMRDRSHILVEGPFGLMDMSGIPRGRVFCPRAYYLGELEFEGSPFAVYLERYEFDSLSAMDNSLTLDFLVEAATVFCINELPGEVGTFQGFDRYRGGRMSLRFQKTTEGIRFPEDQATFDIPTPPDVHYY